MGKEPGYYEYAVRYVCMGEDEMPSVRPLDSIYIPSPEA